MNREDGTDMRKKTTGNRLPAVKTATVMKLHAPPARPTRTAAALLAASLSIVFLLVLALAAALA